VIFDVINAVKFEKCITYYASPYTKIRIIFYIMGNQSDLTEKQFLNRKLSIYFNTLDARLILYAIYIKIAFKGIMQT
jgi:hypothetical protein